MALADRAPGPIGPVSSATGARRGVVILVVEDEADLREMLAMDLARAGYTVREAPDVAAAWGAVRSELPDLVLLDWMLPDRSGIELLSRLRRDPSTRDIPVVMLTARGEEADRVRGLESGADDYVPKPFSPRELRARVTAVLRRTTGSSDDLVRAGILELDVERHRVRAGDADIHLGPTEFRLLHFLMDHPERVYTREQLLDHAWGPNVFVEERTVVVHIHRLRKALAPHGADRQIQTVRGFGYRLATGE